MTSPSARDHETLDMFAGALREIADGPHSTGFQDLTEGLLRRLAEKGATLEQLCDRRMLNRSRATLEGHCSRLGIRFPDFVPSRMCIYVEFDRRGDFLELRGEHVEAIARALGLVVTERDGEPEIGIPAHSFDSLKPAMRKAGFKAKRANTSKVRGSANG